MTWSNEALIYEEKWFKAIRIVLDELAGEVAFNFGRIPVDAKGVMNVSLIPEPFFNEKQAVAHLAGVGSILLKDTVNHFGQYFLELARRQYQSFIGKATIVIDGGVDLLLAGSFTVENAYALNYLASRPYEFAQESISSLLQALRSEWGRYLSEGIRQGATIYELIERLETIFRGTEREAWWRARRIARTEAVGASNMGARAAYGQAGVPYKTWSTVADELVRDNHIPMHLVSIPMNDKFILPDGAQMEAPGDPAGGPKNIISCRCVLMPDFAPPSTNNDRRSTFQKGG